MHTVNSYHFYILFKWCIAISIAIHQFLIILIISAEYSLFLRGLIIEYIWYIINLLFIPTFYISIIGILIALTYVGIILNCKK